MNTEKILNLIKGSNIKFVDLRFIDTKGKEQHITVPASIVDESFLTKEGKCFDGSSIAGWKGINESDMVLMPDLSSYYVDPFCEEQTINLRCDIFNPNKTPYSRDPRQIAKRAEEYLKQTGIADQAFFGPEPEFFIFDDVRWQINMHTVSFNIDSEEASWNSNKTYETGNRGHRPVTKGGYFPVPPVDSAQDIRSTISQTLTSIGIIVEAHHHEVATACQNEIATRFNSLVKKADEILTLKYIVHNVAHAYGKTATFMAKPLVGDNGNGMHCHQSLVKNGENLFAGNQYADLSELALHYIGGIIRHARALNAFTNPGTNSYRRLVPGFEAPVTLAYSSCNRSAAIRIPHVFSPQAKRIEVRFPDAMANPYLAFSAMLLAGLDGIKHRIDPGAALDQNLYELSPQMAKELPTVCYSLESALHALKSDHAFLLDGDVFSMDFIDSYCDLKQEEIERLRSATHPLEFELYYSL